MKTIDDVTVEEWNDCPSDTNEIFNAIAYGLYTGELEGYLNSIGVNVDPNSVYDTVAIKKEMKRNKFPNESYDRGIIDGISLVKKYG